QKRGKMHITRRFVFLLFIASVCCILLLSGCITSKASLSLAPTPLPLGTTIYTYRGDPPLYAVAWSPDGKRIASGDAAGTVQVRNATTGAIVFSVHGHTNIVWAVAWSPAGKRIASASWDNTVQVWDAYTG